MSALGEITAETLKLVREAQTPRSELAKAFTQATGLVNINLERPAKILYPVLTPLRNMIPRVGTTQGGTGVNWRAITGINTGLVSPGVSEGNRSGTISTQVKSYLAAFKTLGLEDNVSFEADLADDAFDDVRARMIEGLLRSVMIEEENVILGGNNSKALGTATTPAVTTAGTGGSIGAAVDVFVSVVYLTVNGFRSSTVAAGLPGQVTRARADGSGNDVFGGFNGQISAAASVTTGGGSTNSVTATVTPSTTVRNGVFAYAWYWGPTAGAAQTLGAITTVNTVVITTATGTGTQAANAAAVAADFSTNNLIYDGLLYVIAGAGQENPAAAASGAQLAFQATTAGTGTPLTSDNAGGIVEIDADLKSFWDNFRLGPSHIFVNAQELLNITKKVIASGGTPLFRFMVDGGAGGSPSAQALTIHGGSVIGTYLNKYTLDGGQLVKVVLHPNMPPGAIMYYSERIPYQFSNVPNPVQILARREYHQIDWPIRRRTYEAGVYVDEVLQMYFPPAFGVRNNIGNG